MMKKADVVLIGSGIVSTTLGMMLKILRPELSILLLEKEDALATESTLGWHNAGTGHAAYCELNYTPAGENQEITPDKAQEINTSFEVSLQFWAYLVEQGIISNDFIHKTAHMSFVWGKDNVEFLQNRYDCLSKLAQFATMQYSDKTGQLTQWMPLVMKGRDDAIPCAATRIEHGTDVDFGKLTRSMLDYLGAQPGFEIWTHNQVQNFKRKKGAWQVLIKNNNTGKRYTISTPFVFIGAGGASLPLLQKTKINQAELYGGFPVSGQFLICNNPNIVSKHHAKVYGKAAIGAPPMSVPHLDIRIIDGQKSLLFGPFAGATTKFLNTGSVFDVLKSVHRKNIMTLLKVAANNMPLVKYLPGELKHTHKSRMAVLREYYPEARDEDWHLIHAGKRVQVIKKTPEGAKLQFGTELVISDDTSVASLLGASPGASTVASIALEVIEKCFGDLATEQQEKITEIIPSYGKSLTDDEELLGTIRAHNQHILDIS